VQLKEIRKEDYI
jgi:hypothetical protein